MWINRETGVWRYVYLGLVVGGLMFFLLFRVWPEWLRLGVWYLSWYCLVFLVSSDLIYCLDWNGNSACNSLVRCFPCWH